MHTNNKAYRFLIATIAWSVLLHVLALVGMLAFLAPGLDMESSVAERAEYVNSHIWQWRAGWLPWQLTALSDLFVSIALVIYYRSKIAGLTAIITLATVCSDLTGEAIFVTSHIFNAQSDDLTAFLDTEKAGLHYTGTLAAGGYCLMSIGWMLSPLGNKESFRKNRWFVIVGLIMILLFTSAVWVNFQALKSPDYSNFSLLYPINGIAFSTLLIWMLWMGAIIGNQHHKDNPRDDVARHFASHPNPLISFILNAPGLRDQIRILIPFFPKLRSDIKNVVYINWLVPADRVAHLLPSQLELDIIDGKTWISLLQFQHGHLGPRCLGPLRKLLPSPTQSNWRLYLAANQNEPSRNIYFFKNYSSSLLTTIGARLFSDGLPLQYATGMTHAQSNNSPDTYNTLIPSSNKNPHLQAIVETSNDQLDKDQIDYLIHQNAGKHYDPVRQCYITSHISIPIDQELIIPAQITKVICPSLADITEGIDPVAFIVPNLSFTALGEEKSQK